jgi:hypothetical protein
VYERNLIEIENQREMPKEFHGDFGWSRNYDNHFLNLGYSDTKRDCKKYKKAKFFIIGFCGKLYLGWKLFYSVEEFDVLKNVMTDVPKVDIIYGYENVKDFINCRFWKRNLDDDVKYVLNYDPINIFREINAPVFVYDSALVIKNDDYGRKLNLGVFIINPILKDYEFYKIIDTFTAFQEISMFLGGVLGRGEKEIIEVDDKYKIKQHGFDKWSFRKEPENKK